MPEKNETIALPAEYARSLAWVRIPGLVETPPLEVLGGKATGLWRMGSLGLRVPPSFTIAADFSQVAEAADAATLDMLWTEVGAGVEHLQVQTGRQFGQGPDPLLVSVRSGAAISMPGMMDTILNVGLTSQLRDAMVAEEVIDSRLADELWARLDASFPSEQGAAVAERLPDDVWEQLRTAVLAVFASWHSPRAKLFRKINGISDALGTAVTVQAMALGNRDDASGTGILLTRDPVSGDATPAGEYMRRAQGEDLVSGERTPSGIDLLQQTNPEAFSELVAAGSLLEATMGFPQEIEFTIETGRLYLLQHRAAKLSPEARVRTLVDMVGRGVLSEEGAMDAVTLRDVETCEEPRLRVIEGGDPPVARGFPASPGVAVGIVASQIEDVLEAASPMILARKTTSPHDLQGIAAAAAVITERGGSTSHAAVVCRSLTKPCVTGCGDDAFSSIGGSIVTVDGGAGLVYLGESPVEDYYPFAAEAAAIGGWLRSRTRVQVLSPHEVPTGSAIVELADEEVDAEGLAARLRGLKPDSYISGPLLAQTTFIDAGGFALVAAGRATIVSDRPLAMLYSAVLWEQSISP